MSQRSCVWLFILFCPRSHQVAGPSALWASLGGRKSFEISSKQRQRGGGVVVMFTRALHSGSKFIHGFFFLLGMKFNRFRFIREMWNFFDLLSRKWTPSSKFNCLVYYFLIFLFLVQIERVPISNIFFFRDYTCSRGGPPNWSIKNAFFLRPSLPVQFFTETIFMLFFVRRFPRTTPFDNFSWFFFSRSMGRPAWVDGAAGASRVWVEEGALWKWGEMGHFGLYFEQKRNLEILCRNLEIKLINVLEFLNS